MAAPLQWRHCGGALLSLLRRSRIGRVILGEDGWPLRHAVEAAWREVIAGQRSRESVHDWSVPWVEGDAAHGHPKDLMVASGLQYLHGLDMTTTPETPNLVSHGGAGSYVLSADEITARLEYWLVMCREYDDDPEGFVQRRRELARQRIARERPRRSS